MTFENIIDIIARPKYQNTPCPIWGDPDKEEWKLLLNALDSKPKKAKKKGIKIKGW